MAYAKQTYKKKTTIKGLKKIIYVTKCKNCGKFAKHK